jgi:hypothetical protein
VAVEITLCAGGADLAADVVRHLGGLSGRYDGGEPAGALRQL